MTRTVRAARRVAAVAAGLVGGLLAAMPGAAYAQQPTTEPASIETLSIDLAKYPIVTLDVAVSTDVNPAQAQGLKLTENGTAVPVTVERLNADDLQVVLVIDTSGSMNGKPLDAARNAAIAFLSRLPEATPVAVVGFGDRAAVLSPFGADRNATKTALASLRARGETALYDGIVIASALYPKDAGGRKVMVVLSDGGDTRSTAGLDSAVLALTSAKATLYSVALETKETDHLSLRTLSAASAGRSVSADDTVALSSTFDQVAALVVNQYRLRYTSMQPGPAALRLEVAGTTRIHRLERPLDYPSAAPPAPPSPQVAPVTSRQAIPEKIVVPATNNSGVLLFGGIGAVFAALALAALHFLSPMGKVRHLAREMGLDPRKVALGRVSERAVDVVDRAMVRSRRQAGLQARLQAAGLSTGAAEALAAVLAAALIACLGALMLKGFLASVVAPAAVLVGSAVTLGALTSRRRHRFAAQLDTTLQLMTSSLRSGLGVPQAIDAVAREAMSPTGDEFRRAVRESRIGREINSALRDIGVRMANEDFVWVVDAIEINREVGGSLAEVLDNVSVTLRDRNRLRRQVRALSAEGRLSALVLTALPLLLFAYIKTANPDYIEPLFTQRRGQMLLLAGTALLALGTLWMRRIVRIRF